MGGRPWLIGASSVCAAGRDRLFRVNFPIYANKDEKFIKNERHNELRMVPLGNRLAFWDEGWGPGPDFRG